MNLKHSTLSLQCLRPGRAEFLFNDLHTAEIIPDQKTFVAMLSAYGKVGWTKDAEQSFDCLQQFGYKADIHAYNALIEAYGFSV